jgi:hypothetical protein
MRVTPSASTLQYKTLTSYGRDGLSNTLGRKRLTLEYFRRLKERGPRGRVIEFTLIALLIAFAALQAFFVFGPRAI